MILWLGIGLSKFYSWRKRYGQANEHNASVPRDHWLTDDEKRAIRDYEREHPREGYRRLTFMMLDDDIAAAAPATVYRVLKKARRLGPASPPNERKGKGFHQPSRPHRHWHIDVSYINIAGTFYYLCSVLDGYSRYIVHWEIREKMAETDVETILQRAREKFPGETPRIISDNGPQFIAKDFKPTNLRSVPDPYLRDDTCTHLALLSAKQWEDRTLAQEPQERVYSPDDAAFIGRCPAVDRAVCDALQYGPIAFGDRLRHPGRQTTRLGRRDSRRP